MPSFSVLSLDHQQKFVELENFLEDEEYMSLNESLFQILVKV